VLDRFFAVLTITSSFLVRFWPVKYRIEALITFFRMVKERSVRFSFRSGPRSGQTLVKLGQPWSNLVEFGQSSPNSGKCIPDRVSRVFGHSGPQSGQKRSGQTRSTLVKPGQTSGDVSRIFFLGSFDVASLRWVRPARLGCLVLRVYTRENPVGKNGVMTVSAKVILLVGHDDTLHDLIEFGNSWGLQTY
jgi:hypothetical protein